MHFFIVSSNSSLIQFSAFQYLIHSLTSVQIRNEKLRNEKVYEKRKLQVNLSFTKLKNLKQSNCPGKERVAAAGADWGQLLWYFLGSLE